MTSSCYCHRLKHVGRVGDRRRVDGGSCGLSVRRERRQRLWAARCVGVVVDERCRPVCLCGSSTVAEEWTSSAWLDLRV